MVFYFFYFFTTFLAGLGGDFFTILGALGSFLAVFLVFGFLTGFSTGLGNAGATLGGSTFGGANLHFLLFIGFGRETPIYAFTPLNGSAEHAIITS